MKMDIRFDHPLHSKVLLVELERVGTVVAVSWDGAAQYRVVYWWDGQRRAEWLNEYELKAVS